MPKFGSKSRKELATCHPLLQALFNEVIKHYNCSILKGRRGKKEQDQLFAEERSKLEYPNSKHNAELGEPSFAVDVVPWFKNPPHIRWNDRNKFYEFCGFVQGVARLMGIGIRSGSNWDMDDELDDQNFNDLPHFELI